MNDRQIDRLCFTADQLAQTRSMMGVAVVLKLVELRFETCTDLEGVAMYRFLRSLNTAMERGADRLFEQIYDEEDD
jgi:hypothetical protein